MLTGFANGGLELRRAGDGSARLRGRFPYKSMAVLSDGGRSGRPRKETFAPRAFSHSVENAPEIHLLVGHSFDKPLASRRARTLDLTDGEDALRFEATIGPEMQETTHVRDALAGVAAGLIVGISPGFRIPPERTVPNAEEVSEEDPKEGRALIRTINEAILFELSLVVRPAYGETEIEARNWLLDRDPIVADPAMAGLHNAMRRWGL